MDAPVAPRTHSGCPDRNAYATPDIALDNIISVAPNSFPVYSAKSAPNAMAGARHAKKRKATLERHRPSHRPDNWPQRLAVWKIEDKI